jgi:hypothetical protein
MYLQPWVPSTCSHFEVLSVDRWLVDVRTNAKEQRSKIISYTESIILLLYKVCDSHSDKYCDWFSRCDAVECLRWLPVYHTHILDQS